MDEIEDKIIEDLIISGALQFAGIDEQTGEMLYSFSNEIKTIMPELYNEHLKNVNKDIMFFWEQGYLDVDLFEDNPTVSLTNKGINEENLEALTNDQKRSFNEIKRVLTL